MSDTNLCMNSKLKYTYRNKYAFSKLAQQRLLLLDGPRVKHYEHPAVFYRDSLTGTATRIRWILSKYLPCLHSFQARPEADQLLNRSRFVEYFCAMSAEESLHESHASVTSYACSTVAQQKFMRQGGSRVTHYERQSASLLTLSQWHSPKNQMNLVHVFAMLPLIPG